MQSAVLDETSGSKTYALILRTGEEVGASLLAFVKEQGLSAARFAAVGACERATIGYFDWEAKTYLPIVLDEQMEVASLVGDIALVDGTPGFHAHVVLGIRDGTARAGHLLEIHVRPTMEIMLTETAATLRRTKDPDSGIPLINVGASTVD